MYISFPCLSLIAAVDVRSGFPQIITTAHCYDGKAEASLCYALASTCYPRCRMRPFWGNLESGELEVVECAHA